MAVGGGVEQLGGGGGGGGGGGLGSAAQARVGLVARLRRRRQYRRPLALRKDGRDRGRGQVSEISEI
jgi:hypothetical protein